MYTYTYTYIYIYGSLLGQFWITAWPLLDHFWTTSCPLLDHFLIIHGICIGPGTAFALLDRSRRWLFMAMWKQLSMYMCMHMCFKVVYMNTKLFRRRARENIVKRVVFTVCASKTRVSEELARQNSRFNATGRGKTRKKIWFFAKRSCFS